MIFFAHFICYTHRALALYGRPWTDVFSAIMTTLRQISNRRLDLTQVATPSRARVKEHLNAFTGYVFKVTPCAWKPQVIEVHLPGNNMNGVLPPTIGSMDELRVLELRENRLEGLARFPSDVSMCVLSLPCNVCTEHLSGRASTPPTQQREG